jgi:hypothetical protein
MDVQAEVDLPTQRQKRAWAPAVLLCILASPVFLVLKTLAFMLGLKLFLFLFGAFLVVAVVGFLLGPVSVVWSGYIAVTEVILGFRKTTNTSCAVRRKTDLKQKLFHGCQF